MGGKIEKKKKKTACDIKKSQRVNSSVPKMSENHNVLTLKSYGFYFWLLNGADTGDSFRF